MKAFNVKYYTKDGIQYRTINAMDIYHALTIARAKTKRNGFIGQTVTALEY